MNRVHFLAFLLHHGLQSLDVPSFLHYLLLLDNLLLLGYYILVEPVMLSLLDLYEFFLRCRLRLVLVSLAVIFILSEPLEHGEPIHRLQAPCLGVDL